MNDAIKKLLEDRIQELKKQLEENSMKYMVFMTQVRKEKEQKAIALHELHVN